MGMNWNMGTSVQVPKQWQRLPREVVGPSLGDVPQPPDTLLLVLDQKLDRIDLAGSATV